MDMSRYLEQIGYDKNAPAPQTVASGTPSFYVAPEAAIGNTQPEPNAAPTSANTPMQPDVDMPSTGRSNDLSDAAYDGLAQRATTPGPNEPTTGLVMRPFQFQFSTDTDGNVTAQAVEQKSTLDASYYPFNKQNNAPSGSK